MTEAEAEADVEFAILAEAEADAEVAHFGRGRGRCRGQGRGFMKILTPHKSFMTDLGHFETKFRKFCVYFFKTFSKFRHI